MILLGHVLRCGIVLGLAPTALGAQTPPARLDWSADDSARIAFAEAHARAFPRAHAIVWAPVDSLDPTWLAGFVDSLDQALAHLGALIGGPYPWRRIANRPVRFYLSPGRFVSHASGRDAVFISLRAVRERYAPYLHEAAHELLAAPAPFYPWEYPDSAAQEAAAARFPVWLSEGLADYLAQTVAAATGFPRGRRFRDRRAGPRRQCLCRAPLRQPAPGGDSGPGRSQRPARGAVHRRARPSGPRLLCL